MVQCNALCITSIHLAVVANAAVVILAGEGHEATGRVVNGLEAARSSPKLTVTISN
ncbi:MAG: hypothetical protein ACI8TL_000647 [Natronomonas sp.]|jgi:hypothetical protein